jgi:hypothetical protein
MSAVIEPITRLASGALMASYRRHVAGDDLVVHRDRRDVLRPAVDGQVHVGDQAAERGGAGDGDAVDHAVVCLVGVPAEHRVDLVVEAVDDVDDRARDAGAAVVAATGRGAALVQQDHDVVDAAALQPGHQGVGGVGLVEEVVAGHALGGDDRGRALEGHADEGDLRVVLEPLDRVRREQRLAGLLGHDVGGEEPEVGAGEVVAVEAAVGRVAPALLQPQQLVGALVELVVADGVDVEPDVVHRLDRGLVVEQGRQQRAGADEVAGRHHDGVVGVGGLELGDVRGEVLGAAGVDALDAAARPCGRGEVAVEVVEAEDLHLDRRRVVAAATTAPAPGPPRPGAGDEGAGDDHQAQDPCGG